MYIKHVMVARALCALEAHSACRGRVVVDSVKRAGARTPRSALICMMMIRARRVTSGVCSVDPRDCLSAVPGAYIPQLALVRVSV